MYDNVYQEYINNMLGGTLRNQSLYENMPNNTYNNFQNQNNTTNMELEKLYPELYRLLYPMIQAACMRNTKPLTEETIDEMVRDIYSNFSADDATILNINLTNEVRSNEKTNEIQKNSSSKVASKSALETRDSDKKETRNIRPNNFVLNDLIRILLIRELLGRPGNFPPIRPGFPPPRPGPGPGPGGRPPFRPREFGFDSQDIGIYEEPYMYSNFNNSTIF